MTTIPVNINPVPVITVTLGAPGPAVAVELGTPGSAVEVTIDKSGPKGSPGIPGAPGPPGEQGSPGVSDASFVYDAIVPSDTWTITHDLGRRPSVTVVDSANTVVAGDVEYLSDNALVITFAGAFSGSAYLN